MSTPASAPPRYPVNVTCKTVKVDGRTYDYVLVEERYKTGKTQNQTTVTWEVAREDQKNIRLVAPIPTSGGSIYDVNVHPNGKWMSARIVLPDGPSGPMDKGMVVYGLWYLGEDGRLCEAYAKVIDYVPTCHEGSKDAALPRNPPPVLQIP